MIIHILLQSINTAKMFKTCHIYNFTGYKNYDQMSEYSKRAEFCTSLFYFILENDSVESIELSKINENNEIRSIITDIIQVAVAKFANAFSEESVSSLTNHIESLFSKVTEYLDNQKNAYEQLRDDYAKGIRKITKEKDKKIILLRLICILIDKATSDKSTEKKEIYKSYCKAYIMIPEGCELKNNEYISKELDQKAFFKHYFSLYCRHGKDSSHEFINGFNLSRYCIVLFESMRDQFLNYIKSGSVTGTQNIIIIKNFLDKFIDQIKWYDKMDLAEHLTLQEQKDSFIKQWVVFKYKSSIDLLANALYFHLGQLYFEYSIDMNEYDNFSSFVAEELRRFFTMEKRQQRHNDYFEMIYDYREIVYGDSRMHLINAHSYTF